MKKTFVLVVLFILPLVAYLFFASGVNNFGILPTVDDTVQELPSNETSVQLSDHISVVCFLGSDLLHKKGNAFNLNQKIYKRFFEFQDFQFVVIVPIQAADQIQELKNDLSGLVDVQKWNFVILDPTQIQAFYSSLTTDQPLDNNFAVNEVYLVDKKLVQRGRNDQDKEHPFAGYDATNVATLTNVMIDDVKILLAEYRLALKKNNADR